jgi:hypothetical protein
VIFVNGMRETPGGLLQSIDDEKVKDSRPREEDRRDHARLYRQASPSFTTENGHFDRVRGGVICRGVSVAGSLQMINALHHELCEPRFCLVA